MLDGCNTPVLGICGTNSLLGRSPLTALKLKGWHGGEVGSSRSSAACDDAGTLIAAPSYGEGTCRGLVALAVNHQRCDAVP